MRLETLVLLWATSSLFAPACGGGGGGAGETPDASQSADGSADPADAGGSPDAEITTISETEPNDGAELDHVNPIEPPVTVTGSIDPADDVDIFTVELSAGSRWSWELASGGSSFAPHLVVTDASGEAPVSAALGEAGADARLGKLALVDDTYNVIVRDARNVPSDQTEGAGGSDHTYSLTLVEAPTSPTSVSVPSTTAVTLSSSSEIAVFELTLDTETDLSVTVNARRLDSPSDVDSRLTLFRASDGWWQTNDDLSNEQLDSLLEGTLPAGTYLAVVENIDPEATDLRVELEITSN